MQKYEQGFWVLCRPNCNVLRALIPKCFWYVRVFKIVHAVQAYVYSFHTARHLSCCEIVVWWCVCTLFFTVIWFIIFVVLPSLFTKFVDTWNNPCWHLFNIPHNFRYYIIAFILRSIFRSILISLTLLWRSAAACTIFSYWVEVSHHRMDNNNCLYAL